MSGLNLEALCVSVAPVPKKMTINGEEVTLWFREVSDQDWQRYVVARGSENADVMTGARAFLISKSLCNADGTHAIEIARAAQLKMPIAKAMVETIMEIASATKATAGNASAPGADATGSGTS